MTYLIRTGATEHHVIQAERPESVMDILRNHLIDLWGEEEAKRLLLTTEVVGEWDETPGYKATFYGEDEGEKIRLILPERAEPIIE